MKLSKDQLDAVYDCIREELNSDLREERRAAERENKKRVEEAVEKFKKTKEYEAVMLLKNTFKGHIEIQGWASKDGIESLAIRMFKPERKSPYVSYTDGRKAIALLAIDCKNLAELNEKVKAHFKLKTNIKVKPYEVRK